MNSVTTNLKQNEAQSARTESTNKGVNQRSKCVTRVQQQRPESPTITLTWHAWKYKVHKLHQRYTLRMYRNYTLAGPGESYRRRLSGDDEVMLNVLRC